MMGVLCEGVLCNRPGYFGSLSWPPDFLETLLLQQQSLNQDVLGPYFTYSSPLVYLYPRDGNNPIPASGLACSRFFLAVSNSGDSTQLFLGGG